MRSRLTPLILLLLLGLESFSQCFNSDFETGNIDGYTPFIGNIAFDGTVTINNEVFSPTQHKVHFVLDGFDEIAEMYCTENKRLPKVPQGGGAYALRLGNSNNGAQAERVTLNFKVTEENNFFLLNYAVLLNDPSHQPHEQPRFSLSITDSDGNEFPCGFFEAVAAPNIENFENCGGNWKVRPWTAIGIELQSYIGEEINIQMSTTDCALGGHAGYAYLDATCKPLEIELFNNCGPGSSAKMFVTTGFDRYEWSTGDSTSIITIDNPVIGDTYFVTVTSATGCSIVLSDTIPPISQELDPFFAPSTVTTICDEVAFNFRPDGTNLTKVYSVELDRFIDSMVINNVTQDSYTFIAFTNSGCAKDTVTHFFNGLPFVLDSIAPTDCSGTDEGSITLSPLVAGGEYSYKWSNGDTTNAISNLVAGTYVVTVSDENCDVVLDYQVEQPDPIGISVDQDRVICRGFGAEATFNVSGGTPPFVYAYNNGGTFYTNSSTYQQFVEGNNVIYVRDKNNCIDSVTIFFPLVELPEILSFDILQDSCGNPGNEIRVTGTNSGLPPYEYNVDFSAPFSSETSFNDFSIGPHTLYVRDANECINSAQFEFEFYEQFFITGVQVTQTTCTLSNGDVTIGTSQTDQVQYAIDNLPYQTSNFFGQLAPGQHTAYAFNRNGCLLIRDFTIQPSFLPDPIETRINNQCHGNSLGQIILVAPTAVNPYTYQWSTGQTTGTICDLEDGTYTVTVTDSDQCVNTFTYEITSPSLLEMDVTSDFLTCQDRGTAELIINAVGGAGGYSYSFNGGASFQVDNFLRGATAGSYEVQVRDANSCIMERVVTVDEHQPYEGIQINVGQDTCMASMGSLSIENVINGAPPHTYSINGTNFQVTPQYDNLGFGEYTLYVRDANGCVWEESFAIDTVFSLHVNADMSRTTCGEDNGRVEVDVSSDFGNSYYLNDSLVGMDPLLTGLSAGSYNLVVENEFGCRDMIDIMIVEGVLPQPTELIVDNDCHDGMEGSITLTNPFLSTIYDYTWSTGAQGSTITELGIGTYSVTVTDMDDCESFFDYEVVSPPEMTLGITGTFFNCPDFENGEISIAASGGEGDLEYSIDGGANYGSASLYSGLPSGTYEVYIRDENLCIKDTSVSVIDYVLEDDIQLVLAMDTCVAANGAVTIENLTQQVGPYRYSIDGSEFYSDTSFLDLAHGDYTLYIEDGNGCIWDQNFQLDTIFSLHVSADVVDTQCNEDNGELVIETSSDFNNRYFLNSELVGEDLVISNLAAGPYVLMVRNEHGCSDTVSTTIAASLEPLIDDVEIVYLSCEDNLNDVSIPVSSGNPPFTYTLDGGSPQSSNTYSNLSPGDHVVQVVDEMNCMKQIGFFIEEFEPLEVAFDFVQPSCDQANGTVTFDISGGAGPIMVVHEGESYPAEETIVGLLEGSREFELRDTTDCVRSVTIFLEAECTYYIPTIFTPDDDGINDVFEIFFSAGASPTISEFSVYDRWGGLVTRQSDVDLLAESVSWDGRFNNQDALPGVYTFVLSGQFTNGKEFFEYGTITLYR